MAIEIERKFLVGSNAWREQVHASRRLRQGYLSRGATASIRVRIADTRAQLGVKSTSDGIHRLEYEYDIPLADAEEMLERIALRPLIDKTRHLIRHAGHLWEVDEFHGENAPLILAEVELAHAEQAIELPDWIGREVSSDPRYYNSNLSERPYSTWLDDEDAG
jgi:adenylate cyclase